MDLRDDLGIVRSILVEPKDRRDPGGTGTIYGQLHPVPHGLVLSLAGTPYITFLNHMLDQQSALSVEDPNASTRCDFERLVVRAILFGLLRHEPDVRDTAHGRRIELPVRLAVPENPVVDAGVARIRNNGLYVL